MLQKFFPGMENFETQVRKYKREIDYLEKENAVLAKKAALNEKGFILRCAGKISKKFREQV